MSVDKVGLFLTGVSRDVTHSEPSVQAVVINTPWVNDRLVILIDDLHPMRIIVFSVQETFSTRETHLW